MQLNVHFVLMGSSQIKTCVDVVRTNYNVYYLTSGSVDGITYATYNVCRNTYTHHTSGPELLKHLLEISLFQSDLEFLKYLIDDKKVDVNGEYMNFCGLVSSVCDSRPVLGVGYQ